MTSPPNASVRELSVVQNPGLGAVCLWRYHLGYQSSNELPSPFALSFLVLPLILHKSSLEMIVSTNRSSGLALFAAKLGKENENLLAIQSRAISLRTLTLQSIAIGVETQLLKIDYKNATIRARTPEIRPTKPRIPERLRSAAASSEKIGIWFSTLNISQIAPLLRIAF